MTSQAKKTPQEIGEILADHEKEVQLLIDPAKGYANLITTSVEIVSPKCINTAFGNQTLFVYCDMADYQPVGDSVAHILRTVPIKANSAFQMIVEKFDTPHYVKVIRNYIENVEITIASDLGKDAEFKVGKSLAKLHLRKVETPQSL